MTKKDSKKVEHTQERHHIAKEILSVKGSQNLSTDKKNELIKELLAKKEKTETKNESKETLEKLPELEDENFKVKDTTNRKEITDLNGVKVKVNPEGDVREQIEGDFKGKQLFTRDSALREANKAGKTLPASWTTYRDIINKKYEGNFQDFLKGEKLLFSSYLDEGFGLRCADGSCFGGYGNAGDDDGGVMPYGFPVRCLK